MADSPDNPYAPPTAEPGPIAAESGQGWAVEGDYLMFRPDTQLPPVALQGQGDWLTPGVRRFAVLAGGRGMALAFIPTFILVGWVVYSRRVLDGNYFWVGFIVIIVLGRIFGRIFGRRGGSASTVQASLKGFFPVETLRVTSRRYRWISRLLLGGLALMGVGIVMTTSGSGRSLLGLGRRYGDDYFLWVGSVMGVSVVLMLGALIWKAVTPELRSTSFRNGWVYLRGVPRETLALLAAKSRQEPPPLRKRRVVKFYQYRLPLATLLHHNRLNPWLVFWLTIFKFTRAKSLIRLRFCDREQSPVREADPDLLRRWEEGTRGTPMAAWQEISRECQDSPQGDMRVLGLSYAAPDGRSFCTMIVVRVSVMNLFSENFQTSFQSWTEDGRMITTSSPPRAFASPPHVDARTVSGSLQAICQAHLVRVADLPLVIVRDREHFAELTHREVAALNEFYEANGYQSAPEEIDWRDVPE